MALVVGKLEFKVIVIGDQESVDTSRSNRVSDNSVPDWVACPVARRLVVVNVGDRCDTPDRHDQSRDTFARDICERMAVLAIKKNELTSSSSPKSLFEEYLLARSAKYPGSYEVRR